MYWFRLAGHRTGTDSYAPFLSFPYLIDPLTLTPTHPSSLIPYALSMRASVPLVKSPTHLGMPLSSLLSRHCGLCSFLGSLSRCGSASGGLSCALCLGCSLSILATAENHSVPLPMAVSQDSYEKFSHLFP